MTNFEKLKGMDLENLTDWLDKNGDFEESDWLEWFDNKYCKKCESEVVWVEEWGKECECSYCELKGKCQFFPEMEREPNVRDIIKMWLEAEYAE